MSNISKRIRALEDICRRLRIEYGIETTLRQTSHNHYTVLMRRGAVLARPVVFSSTPAKRTSKSCDREIQTLVREARRAFGIDINRQSLPTLSLYAGNPSGYPL